MFNSSRGGIALQCLIAIIVLSGSLKVHAQDSASQPAIWTPRELLVQYQGFTTRYSCEGLQQKLRALLVLLGARADLQVTPFDCTRVAGPVALTGMRIRMSVLRPATGQNSPQAVPAHWKTVDVLAKRDPLDAAADCELIDLVGHKILPEFATRAVEFTATCAAHQQVIGSVRLKADVLSADPAAERRASVH